jgi:hypothetical protein
LKYQGVSFDKRCVLRHHGYFGVAGRHYGNKGTTERSTMTRFTSIIAQHRCYWFIAAAASAELAGRSRQT